MTTYVHTNITMSLDSKVDGKRLRNMGPQELCNAVRACGNENTDVTVKDGDKVIASYDSKTGNVYCNMTITDTLFLMTEVKHHVPPQKPSNLKELARQNKTTCRYCKHRLRMEQNFSYKIHQCCSKRPTRRNADGYIHIKVTEPACAMFERDD